MRKLFWVLFLITSCSSRETAPSGVLPKRKMEAVIYDMMLADRYSNQFMINDSLKKDSLKLESMKLFNQVLVFHGVKKNDFYKSFDYYMNRPEEIRVIFDSLVSRSNQTKERLYKKNMH